MPLVETLPVSVDTAQWPVWGTTARLVVTDPYALADARHLVERELAAVDLAASRFRPDSELRQLPTGSCPAGVPVSPLLAELVRVALRVAERTDGDVDPTVGAAMCALGYDRDFADLPPATPAPADGTTSHVAFRLFPTPSWRDVRLDGSRLAVPVGVQLDLGASAKAWAADRCAAVIARECGVGVSVSLGGDMATAGPAPAGGWKIRVQDGPDQPRTTIMLPAGAALATSSTITRRWRNVDELIHHILDPRTGRPAPTTWRTASVAAFNCVEANALSTAALVRGDAGPRFLRKTGAPARLVAADGSVTTIGAWPAEGGSS